MHLDPTTRLAMVEIVSTYSSYLSWGTLGNAPAHKASNTPKLEKPSLYALSMICCQFVFEPGSYDVEFHTLDNQIAEHAKSLPGFISNHTFYSADKTISNAIYFFQDMESVQLLARYPQHLSAKQKVDNWYKGYKIVISEVTSEYGDGNLIYP
jgi:hypothetical protein